MKKGRLKDLDWKKRFEHSKHVVFDEKDFKESGAKFQIVKFAPGESAKAHYHTQQTEVFYILAGKGIIKFNEKEYTAEKDDFFLCEIGDVHEFINISGEDLLVLVFRINEPPDGDIYWKDA
ncbi:MAG: cupin domain-containing protein [Parcubacteria group bacterium]